MSIHLPLEQRWFGNLDWALRRLLGLVLGALFFWAGLQKVFHTFDFVKAIMAYQLVPAAVAGPMAAVLPWVEMLAGLMLMVGFKKRSCLILVSLLLAFFLVAIVITMARGLHIDCGCGLFQKREIGLGIFLEDAFFLAWAIGLYWWELKAAARKLSRVAAETV